MNIETKKLYAAWHKDMTDKEKDIYFYKMKILNARKCQETDRLLSCRFGLSDHIISMNKFHKNMEKNSMDTLRELIL